MVLEVLQGHNFNREIEEFFSCRNVLSILFSPLFFIFNKLSRVFGKKQNLPPSPPRLPIIGNFHQLGLLPHRSLRDLSQKYGPLMHIHLGNVPFLVVSSAEMAREILSTQDVVFAYRPFVTMAKGTCFGGTNLGFAPYGEYWRQATKICVNELLSITKVQSFKSLREEEVSIMMEKIVESYKKGTIIDVGDLVLAMANSLICKLVLGRTYHDNDSKLRNLIREVVVLFGKFSLRDFVPLLGWIDVITGLAKKMKRPAKELGDFLDKIIQDHLTTRMDEDVLDQQDFMDIMLNTEKDSKLNIHFTRGEITAIILDMLVAGTDTTATTVEWAMAELIKNSNKMMKVQEEVRRVMAKKSKVEEDDIYQLEYMHCVIKESLRLHPPSPLLVPREASFETIIEGYNIPPRTRVFINVWAIHRDSKHWSNPQEFIPERFLNSPIDFLGHDYEYLPFGAGQRGCPGISFGMASTKLILANLLYWFNWELPENTKKEDMDMTEAPGTALHKKIPLHLLPKSSF
ncbi:cytochrome P450 71A1-like [Macadamia integrifolia]|uniref:cytochrome P450 71A1-like n=1 Tax=Macadamia integrifolia TaxID=60698 RepID=UPI001C4E6C97|nr:cytochrome P450 71A1-like [Macadamia integrifolia]